MGQKVNPKGLRLGILTTWDSRWMFSNKELYRKSILEDVKIREGLIKKFQFAIVTQVEIERAINRITIIIHAARPGMIIGRGGKGLEDVKKFVMLIMSSRKSEIDKMKIELKVEPVKKPYLNAYFVANEIAGKLIRGLPHRVVVHFAMNKAMESGARGIKVQLGGRINGAAISRREKYYEGTVPVSTIREDIDFARFPALTKSGYIGIKIWIAR
ncbi:30S ribosomal protein S3 [Candidatus Roizmanbacteria bacterium RIFCSPHIGHO2_02_FULL_37_13b]|uniref:Small ribosomal subunit protein uS3 n=1 Tax=Candidatus Roizmanbacteria bacterium RIFCSPLOWO2_02_FULL_36_11 TaxID=1802071 RepID=A0A1F7JCJ8_9BACT|nr:MAG: 30S ribosomal protein S3 [Candidatus Roizmanbacteria bacterium RIFCSPHIGHO2_02_FULL_37_13b]OGK53330.1 MAG: 30S ribosomal protein S3 [Candidatus Roizmanbacteria bacterium RIFCSPLOWO2_02_FULL_36_11]